MHKKPRTNVTKNCQSVNFQTETINLKVTQNRGTRKLPGEWRPYDQLVNNPVQLPGQERKEGIIPGYPLVQSQIVQRI